MEKFGELLRSFRQRCKDPDHPGRGLSQERFGELLGTELGGKFSGAAVSDWERSVSKIHADHRPVLVNIIKVLQECGGITDLKDANALLTAGNYRAPDEKEIDIIFPKDSQTGSSHPNENNQLLMTWPPGIPNEDYYPLPQREEQLSELLNLLERTDGPQMVSIDGLGGIGKTSLAAELARRSVDKGSFQGVIGETAKQEVLAEHEIIQLQVPILGYENLLDALARQLQLWDLFTLEIKSKETILAQTLRRNRYLVFLDNIESVENANMLLARVRSLLGISRTIITSRVKVSFDFAYSFTLESLGLEDSLLFIRSTAERMDVKQVKEASKKTLLGLFQLTGGSPLAMKLAVAQAKFLELNYLVGQMYRANDNLYFFIFKESWEQLSESAQNVLIYIGRTAIETVSLQELSSAGFIDDENELIRSLEQLITYSLLNVSYSHRQIRYGIHQLTRQFIVNDLPAIWKQQGLL